MNLIEATAEISDLVAKHSKQCEDVTFDPDGEVSSYTPCIDSRHTIEISFDAAWHLAMFINAADEY